ncbi:hypothetical protein [Leptospira brenneri]|uniref:hypothetical protein n=1 Tax=Leptospira brenneri TaxID=2023182 RepID=UPI000C296BDD|nr:hypothetical protein [Leptospira brenneri]PJZ43813.1 hypothetical protein CH361_18855 [Leptospira brenneri]
MNKSESLITLARRYCLNHYIYWLNKYLRERTGNDFPYTYTEKDYNLFPRYNALLAILNGIELIVGNQYDSIDECKSKIIELGLKSESPFTKNTLNMIADKSILEERNKFLNYINNLSDSDLINVEPLPHKRRLSEIESLEIRNLLKENWEFNGGYWYPLSPLKTKKAYFLNKDNITESDFLKISNFILSNSNHHLYKITEEQLDYEIDASEFEPNCYETMYTDKNTSWLIYGSHEGTLSFAGSKISNFILNLFSDRTDFINKW